MKKTLNLAFLAFSVVFLISMAFPQTPIHWLLKIVPIGLLFYATAQLPSSNDKWLLLAAVVFSAGGDTLLAFGLFVPGLGSFLIAQLSYAVFFVRHWSSLQTRWPLTVGLIAYVVIIATVLFPHLGDLQVPVLSYLTAISFMGLTAIQARFPVKWIVLGAFSFILSDSLIALDKFLHPLPFNNYSVMITYYAAQWMIIHGSLKYLASNR